MKKHIKYLLIIVFMVFAGEIHGQFKPKVQRYSKFDNKLYHFGFMLGINTTDFSTYYKANLLEQYNIYSIQNKSQPGFQLGLLASLKLGTPFVRLRFIPTISFQERVLDYTYPSSEEDVKFDIKTERVGSTNVDFPLLLKFRTLRHNNFAAYVIAGAQYTIDLQSKEESAQKFGDPFLKIYRNDIQGQVGAGFDFFLTFFKFSVELKFSHGIKNALYQDNTKLSDPINALYNRVWLVSFTFEG